MCDGVLAQWWCGGVSVREFLFFLLIRRRPGSTRTGTLLPSTTLFRSHGNKPPEPANEKMGMGHNRRLWVALSGRRHGTGRLRPGEPPAGTLTRARTAAPTPAAATASASDRAAGTRTEPSGTPPSS